MRILLQLSWKAGLKDPNIKVFKRIPSILSDFISALNILSISGILSMELVSIFPYGDIQVVLKISEHPIWVFLLNL
jgi:hypothetical protein